MARPSSDRNDPTIDRSPATAGDGPNTRATVRAIPAKPGIRDNVVPLPRRATPGIRGEKAPVVGIWAY